MERDAGGSLATSLRSSLTGLLSQHGATLVLACLATGLVVAAARPYLDPKRRRLPPGPIGLPILGSLPFMSGDTTTWIMGLFARYGKIASARLGSCDVVFVGDYEVLKRISMIDAFNYRPPDTVFALLLPTALGNRESLANHHASV